MGPFLYETKLKKSILVYKRISGNCPSCMTQVLIRNEDVNEWTSRREKFEPCLPQFKRESVRSGTQTSWAQVSANFGPVLYQICFKQAIHIPPFYVDGFETRNGKLVYNVQKKNLVLISRSNLPESFTDHIQRAFVFHYRVLILQNSKMNEQ